MLAFQYPLDLKKTTVVVESLSTNTTRCTVPDNTSLLQDLINSMRILHQIIKEAQHNHYKQMIKEQKHDYKPSLILQMEYSLGNKNQLYHQQDLSLY